MLAILLASAISCAALDGDTLVCDGEHIRLLGIDSPEMPGHCRPERHCVSGDPYHSKQTLENLFLRKPVRIYRYGADRYGRTLAVVRFGRKDASCYQLLQRSAVYVRKWDNNSVVSAHCPRIVRTALLPGQSTK
jgi:endonuclease YncB( thermonuclease family)